MGFSDRLLVNDGIAIALNCGLCGRPAEANHDCTRRYLRAARITLVRSLADPDSTDPNDLFLVQLEQGGEEYTTTRVVLARDYEEI